MNREKVLEVVVRTLKIVEDEWDGRTEHIGIRAAMEIADEIFADPTLPDGRGEGLMRPGESPRQARNRINEFAKD